MKIVLVFVFTNPHSKDYSRCLGEWVVANHNLHHLFCCKAGSDNDQAMQVDLCWVAKPFVGDGHNQKDGRTFARKTCKELKKLQKN